jgi:hypothetical protein
MRPGSPLCFIHMITKAARSCGRALQGRVLPLAAAASTLIIAVSIATETDVHASKSGFGRDVAMGNYSMRMYTCESMRMYVPCDSMQAGSYDRASLVIRLLDRLLVAVGGLRPSRWPLATFSKDSCFSGLRRWRRRFGRDAILSCLACSPLGGRRGVHAVTGCRS